MSPDKEIDSYIQKQKSPNKKILIALRKLLHKTIPGCDEKMAWGVPTFRGGRFYIVSLKGSVNLGFAISGLEKDEQALFEGAGKTMRHIKIGTLSQIDTKKLAALIKLVDKKAQTKAVCRPCQKRLHSREASPHK